MLSLIVRVHRSGLRWTLSWRWRTWGPTWMPTPPESRPSTMPSASLRTLPKVTARQQAPTVCGPEGGAAKFLVKGTISNDTKNDHLNTGLFGPQYEQISRLFLGLSRVTDYPWAVRFSVVTCYKFANWLTGSCTDDLLETWSCQNHEKVEETAINPSYIWAKMHLLSVLGS